MQLNCQYYQICLSSQSKQVCFFCESCLRKHKKTKTNILKKLKTTMKNVQIIFNFMKEKGDKLRKVSEK